MAIEQTRAAFIVFGVLLLIGLAALVATSWYSSAADMWAAQAAGYDSAPKWRKAKETAKASAAKLSAAKELDERQFQEAVLIARALQRSMKNPDSFKLEKTLRMPSGALCFSYRATNSFNAVVPGNAVYAAGRLAGTDDAWNHYCGGKTGTIVDGVAMAMSF